ncbi:MAG: hypothetical protein HRU39_01275 [Salinicola sp.]|uniref:hypothetical protein n=1 Tax=Salinicola sp. TaxID=1978524 RepID=UPI001DDC1E4C|nr:hypothetical protein [Salinicola sp.]NRB54602.1 hypothetical protein [Salinicola sp.]
MSAPNHRVSRRDNQTPARAYRGSNSERLAVAGVLVIPTHTVNGVIGRVTQRDRAASARLRIIDLKFCGIVPLAMMEQLYRQ